MKMLRRVIVGCAISYGAGFALWRILVASPLYARWWPLQLSETFALWFLVPLPLLIAAGLIWRSRWLWLALLLPSLWFVREYGDVFLPDLATRAWARGDAASLRVMTLNTWKQTDREGEFVASVRAWQPDLIALQEVNPGLLRVFGDLKGEWPYHAHAYIRGYAHVALLSKTPILSYEADDRWLGCHCMQALVDWRGERVRVIVVHIRAPGLGERNGRGLPLVVRTYDTSEQAATYAALLPLIEASAEPLIVVGDFNTTERAPGYAALVAAGLTDAHEAAGWGPGFTYPAPFVRLRWLPFPVIRIDHIFYDAAWRATDTWTTPLMGSDHQTLVADLQWVGEP